MVQLTGPQKLLGFLVFFALINLSVATLMGIDFGSSSYKVVLPPGGKRRQLLLALNEQSNRKTETLIGFRDEERLFGSFVTNLAKFSPQDTYPYLRDLLGVKTVEAAQARVGKYIPYAHKLVVGDTDYPFVAIKHAENTTFAVHDLIAMIFQQARKIAEKEDGGKIVDCCITVPNFFTQDERQALIDAATVAGLNVLSLINQGTAVGVSYGTEYHFEGENFLQNALFVDFGESSLQLTLGQFTPTVDKGKNVTQFQVLGSTWELIGGRDITHLMVQHIIDIRVRSKVPDVDSKPRVYQKLKQAMTKVKETLSVSNEADYSILNLDGDFDLEGTFKKETLEKLTEELFSVVPKALQRLLDQTAVLKQDIHAIELVGGSTRVPKFQTILKQFFERENLDRHLNADEAGVFGATFFGAGVSGRYKIKGLKVKDINHRNVNALITGNPTQEVLPKEDEVIQEVEAETDSVEGDSVLNKTIKAFLAGSRLGTKRTISFYTTDPFQVKLEYDTEQIHALPVGIENELETIRFTKLPVNKTLQDVEIKGFDSAKMDAMLGQYNLTAKPKAHVKLRIGTGGVIEVSAVAEIHFMERVESKVKVIDEPTEEPKVETTKEETEETKTEESTPKEESTEEAKEEPKETSDEAEKEETQKSKEAPKPKERWETKVDFIKRRKEVTLTQTSTRGALPAHLKIKSKDVLEQQDKIESTRQKILQLKNDLESALYEIKEKYDSQELLDVTNETQREKLMQVVSEVSDWLEYSADGATYLAVKEKFKELEAQTHPIYHRIHEKKFIVDAMTQTKERLVELRNAIQNLSSVLQVHDDNITDLSKKINSTLDWIDTEYEKTKTLASHEDPSLTTNALRKKVENLTGKAKKLLSAPKKRPPKKPKVETNEQDNTEKEKTETGSEEKSNDDPETKHDGPKTEEKNDL